MRLSGPPPSIAFLSTYPPTSCGLATFTAALRVAVAQSRGSDEGLGVLSLVDQKDGRTKPEVVYEHVNGDCVSSSRAIEVLNSFDVAFIQHEYGIYGGPDGSEVVDLMSSLEIPAVVTLHTVLSRPSRSQRSILEKVVALAQRTIVMSQTARRRLVNGYAVDPAKVGVVPHGARASLAGPSLANKARPVVLTWGLIGPGKGLETAIDAFAGLQDLRPLPRYVILGKTHPKVQAAQGDAYLEGLATRAHDLGLDGVVEFDGRYLDADALAVTVRQADVVLLPYESTEQVTSGVLVEALAAGKPIIATAFPHAVELLSSGAGIVVRHGDATASTAALRTVLTNQAAAARMAVQARRIGSTMLWPAIGRRYDDMAAELVGRNDAHQGRSAATRYEKVVDALARVG